MMGMKPRVDRRVKTISLRFRKRPRVKATLEGVDSEGGGEVISEWNGKKTHSAPLRNQAFPTSAPASGTSSTTPTTSATTPSPELWELFEIVSIMV